MITRPFDIPPDRVGVAFIDKHKNTIWLTNEQELQGSVVSTIRESRFGTRVFKILFYFFLKNLEKKELEDSKN